MAEVRFRGVDLVTIDNKPHLRLFFQDQMTEHELTTTQVMKLAYEAMIWLWANTHMTRR